MNWKIIWADSVFEDLAWFHQTESKFIVDMVEKYLGQNPLAETKKLKTLRPNRRAQRELRLRGKYRVLFNVEVETKQVNIAVVGEKRGAKLIVRGEEFTEHHEIDIT